MATDITLPELGETIKEGGVLELRVKPGDVIAAGDIVVVIEAEKSTVEVPSETAGTVAEVLVKQGQTIKPGTVIARIEGGAGAPAKAEVKTEAKAAAAPAAVVAAPPVAPVAPVAPTRNGEAAAPRFSPDQLIPAGPATRRLARKLGVELGGVTGTGPRGRVTQDDVIAAAARTIGTGGGGGVHAPALPDFAKWGPIEAKPLDFVRKKTAEQMAVAWSQIPHVTHHDLADTTDLEAFRRSHDGKGPKLTVTAFALKACAVALKEFPQFNASLDLAAGQIIRKSYYHIGVAVDTDRGLLVPVIRDVDRKSIRDLAGELNDIAEKARTRKLGPDDLKGGTFTISNLGGIGGVGFTPIVNWPEVAILGLSRSRQEPVWKDNGFVPRLMLPLSLSYDHRVIDGADGARFARRVAALLENPMLLLVEA
ncbi:MAG: 2-oxo acid dehydrogenase subunit E2 [Gemmataceae bacterium]|nr:2-oxo acid dehydrogenase subunit E2 [Gemmataceae bacterium]